MISWVASVRIPPLSTCSAQVLTGWHLSTRPISCAVRSRTARLRRCACSATRFQWWWSPWRIVRSARMPASTSCEEMTRITSNWLYPDSPSWTTKSGTPARWRGYLYWVRKYEWKGRPNILLQILLRVNHIYKKTVVGLPYSICSYWYKSLCAV